MGMGEFQPVSHGGPLPLDRKDLRFWIVLWGTAIVFLTAVFGTAWLLTPTDRVFLGSLHDTSTAVSYQAWSLQFSRTGFLADNPSTLERQKPAFFNLVWFIMGRVMAAGVPFLVAYSLFRIFAAGLLLLAILLFMRRLVHDRTMAWAATLLASFGTGFGWVAALLTPALKLRLPIPIDITLGDTFPINTIWTFPHLAMAHVLLLAVYYFTYRAVVERSGRTAALAAGSVLVLGFTHSYYFVTIAAVLGAWFLTLQVKHGRAFSSRWIYLGAILAAMAPGAAYYWWLVKSAPNFIAWRFLSPAFSATFPAVIMGFGLLVPLALLGYRGISPVRKFSDGYLLVVVWLLVQLSLFLASPFFIL